MASLNWYDRRLEVRRSEYQYGTGKQLAILCFDDADPECNTASGNPYGVLTVNLDDPRCEPFGEQYAMQFLDVNNWPGIEWVLDHDDVDWIQKTGLYTKSGYVNYPLYMFDIEKIPHV